MPLLGEVPITSFFKPNLDSKKRKLKAGSAPSLKKRRNEHSEDSKNATRSFKGKEKERELASIMATRTRVNGGEKRKSSMAQRARTPNPPSMMASQKSGDLELFKTPTAQEVLFRNRKPTASGSGHSHTTSTALDYEIIRTPVSFLPTPVSMKRLSLRQLRDSGCHIDETPSTSINSVEIITPTTYNLETMGSDVPSSQSQNILDFIPVAHSLSTRSTLPGKEYSSLPPPPRLGNSFFAPSHGEERDPNIYVGTGARLVVASSQSQAFDGFYEEAQRPSGLHRSCPPEEDSHVVIPSSQSQEGELVLPRLEVKTRSQEKKMQPRFSLSRAKITTNQIQRTLSDELFPITIQHSLLSDIFQQDKAPEDSDRPSPYAQPADSSNDLSATESESEAEEPHRTGNQFARSTIPNDLVPPWRLSPHGTPHHKSTHDDSLGGESQPSQPSPSTMGSPESSYASLPPAVREFQNMFGSNDESYPPDFPMSLR